MCRQGRGQGLNLIWGVIEDLDRINRMDGNADIATEAQRARRLKSFTFKKCQYQSGFPDFVHVGGFISKPVILRT
jgi:hypothetical protein